MSVGVVDPARPAAAASRPEQLVARRDHRHARAARAASARLGRARRARRARPARARCRRRARPARRDVLAGSGGRRVRRRAVARIWTRPSPALVSLHRDHRVGPRGHHRAGRDRDRLAASRAPGPSDVRRVTRRRARAARAVSRAGAARSSRRDREAVHRRVVERRNARVRSHVLARAHVRGRQSSATDSSLASAGAHSSTSSTSLLELDQFAMPSLAERIPARAGAIA